MSTGKDLKTLQWFKIQFPRFPLHKQLNTLLDVPTRCLHIEDCSASHPTYNLETNPVILCTSSHSSTPWYDQSEELCCWLATMVTFIQLLYFEENFILYKTVEVRSPLKCQLLKSDFYYPEIFL